MKPSGINRKHYNAYLKKVIGSLLGISVIMTTISCSFPFQELQNNGEITDISGQLTYKEISRQGFMGGSVLYNPDNPASGQLTDGATVAVRLGFVTSDYVGNDQYTYTDIPEKAQYGTILITNINKNTVTFVYKAYSPQGHTIGNSAHTLTLNNSVDINGDGSQDITYAPPKRKRPGFENAVYLTFISSQEKLTTSMFAVLTDQYSRSVYPSGIIGINPDGRFIVSKYENNGTNRSLISGLQKGDIVVDSIAGKYQQVMTASNARGARTVSDAELEDVESSGTPVSYRFTDTDFTNGYTAEQLFSALPDGIKNMYQHNTSFIETLNLILENRDLIAAVSQTIATPIPDAIFPEVAAQIASLTDDEIIQLNRIFLQETFPAVCPAFINPNEGFVQIIPLASFVFGDSDSIDPVDTQNAMRAASFSEYDAQQDSIKTQFETYKEVFSQKLELKKIADILKIDTKGFNMTSNKTFIKIGIKGTFSNTWGNVSSTIEGVIYLNADIYNDMSASFNKSVTLANKPIFAFGNSINIPVFAYGPIVLNINAGIGTSIPLSFGFTIPMALNGQFGFTGLYGAGIEATVKYGVNWKKVWFIRIPAPYINTSGRGWKVGNTAYYVGASPSSISAGFKNAYIAVSPNIHGNIGVNISGIVGGGLGIEHGIEQRLDIKYEKPSLTGTATTTAYTRLTAQVKIGIDGIPIIRFIGYKREFDIIKPLRQELQKITVFRKNI